MSTSIIASYPTQEQYKSKRLSSPVDERVVASIGKLKITADEFKRGYDYGPAFYKREKKSKEVYLKFLINEKLLALDGYKRRVDTVKQVADMFRAFHDDLITGELFNDEIFNKIKVTDAEIDSVITQKQLELDIKWLYTLNKDEAFNYMTLLNKGWVFDSLFKKQSTDSTLINDRQLKTDLYHIKIKNPVMAKIIDTLKVGKVSLPIHAQDGWYLVKLENLSRNLISTESEGTKLRSESIEAVKMNKMDRFSEQYTVKLMSGEKPVIRKDEFNILRSYIGNYILPKEKYEEWQLAEKLDSTLSVLKIKDKEKIPSLKLVEMKNGSVTLTDILNWYWTRDQYLKFNEKNLMTYSISLEQMIWRMVRDKLLVAEANKRNLSERQSVRNEERLWKDKIVYSYVRNELTNAVMLENKELPELNEGSKPKNNAEKLSAELSKKILRKVNQLKQKEAVKIYSNVLNSINVTDENNPKVIELYTVKKGGLIPRTPYPTIDNDWKSWE
ncbi:MAG: peptidylprolyl isomerase [Ignavibacteriales bacterium]|nr:peptidylprolyl isomerase [Ignavibacteriales bacterium]